MTGACDQGAGVRPPDVRKDVFHHCALDASTLRPNESRTQHADKSCGALSPHDPASAGQYSSRSAAVPRLELGSRPSSAASLRPSPTSKCATVHPTYGCVSSSRRDLEGPHARPRGAGPTATIVHERTHPRVRETLPHGCHCASCPCARARPPPAPWPSQRHLTRASPWLRRAPPLPPLLPPRPPRPPRPPPPPLRQPAPPLPLGCGLDDDDSSSLHKIRPPRMCMEVVIERGDLETEGVGGYFACLSVSVVL